MTRFEFTIIPVTYEAPIELVTPFFYYFEGNVNKQAILIMEKIVVDYLKEGIITGSDFYKDDYHFTKRIEQTMDLMKRIDELISEGVGDRELKTKTRMVNPEVLVNNTVWRLSELN